MPTEMVPSLPPIPQAVMVDVGVVVTLVADVGVVVIDAVRRRPLVGSYRHW
ncbi:hypothetical protein OIPHN330_55610 (plasmid) [Citrobacter freundii]|nr:MULTISPECIES: hypothetical protein [Enterobacteriaceae]EKS9204950.1 hypothetical protein [Enterobacter cloacae]NTX86664.1 hypothetical protein [Citrobacter youngae]HED2825711.1 hypothetical protein [Enterobacter kobei]EJD6095674.1 hypothetical protein [Citrobacter freundii]QXR25805.1 hypothetical protein EGK69_025190 [Citrobacter freundii]